MKSLTANAKNITSVSIVLFAIPFLFFASAFLRELLNVSVPPDSWLENLSRMGSSSWRNMLFAVILILIALIAVILNFISIIWLQNDKEKAEKKIAKRLTFTNIIIIILAGLTAVSFATTMIVD